MQAVLHAVLQLLCVLCCCCLHGPRPHRQRLESLYGKPQHALGVRASIAGNKPLQQQQQQQPMTARGSTLGMGRSDAQWASLTGRDGPAGAHAVRVAAGQGESDSSLSGKSARKLGQQQQQPEWDLLM